MAYQYPEMAFWWLQYVNCLTHRFVLSLQVKSGFL